MNIVTGLRVRTREPGKRGRYLLPTSLAVAAALGVVLGLAGLPRAAEASAVVYSQDDLIADARQLAEIIETTHPDPFVRGGGRIPFFRRLGSILNAIPDEGMTADDFVRLLRPLVASVGDAHTDIWSEYTVSEAFPGGVPVQFGVVESSLYVKGVLGDVSADLLGARLVAVAGRPLEDLMSRQRELVGLENDYHVLLELAERSLYYEPYLAELLPDWTRHDSISVELLTPAGRVETHTFDLPVLANPKTTSPTDVRIPVVSRAGFYAGFLDVATQTEPVGYIRIDHQAGFREFLEENAVAGANDTTPEARALVPSATEAFRELAIAMRDAGTETLIADLRFDTGGTDTMADILVYFLYGWEGLRDYLGERYIAGGFSAMRYSELHFENCSNQTISSVNEGRSGVPIAVGEYEFDVAEGTEEERRAQVEAVDTWEHVADRYVSASTFHDEVAAGEYAGYYTPPNVAVLISPKTFSAGSTTMRALDLAGATLCGTPSGQTMRAFGNGTLWQLDHTGIHGIIARSYFDPYPNDLERSEVWPIAVPLTYAQLACYAFDPNAELLLALDWIEENAELGSAEGEGIHDATP